MTRNDIKRAIRLNFTNMNKMASHMGVGHSRLADAISGDVELLREYHRRKAGVKLKIKMKTVDAVRSRVDRGMTIGRACKNYGISQCKYYEALRYVREAKCLQV